MQFTRKQIIQYLETHKVATIPEMSKIFNLTIGNIRHHVTALIEQGVLSEVGTRPKSGRGRPTKQYSLTKKIQKHNLDHLAGTLFAMLLVNLSPELKEQVLEELAKKMITTAPTTKSPLQRIQLAIQWLAQNEYRPRWEASPTGPRIILQHCPYIAIIEENPELCQLDRQIVTTLLGTPCQQIAKLALGQAGARHCIFASQHQT